MISYSHYSRFYFHTVTDNGSAKKTFFEKSNNGSSHAEADVITVTFNAPQITLREETLNKPRPYEQSVSGQKEGTAVAAGDTPSKPKLNTDLASNPYLNKIKLSQNTAGGKDWWVKTGQKSGEKGEKDGNADFENLPAEDFSYEEEAAAAAPKTKEIIADTQEIKENGKEDVKEEVDL